MAYNQTHAPKLATIDASLAQKYGLSAAMLAGYYQAAKELVEAKKTEIIDTRDRAELVDQYNGLSSEHPESIAAVKAAEAALAKVQAEAAEKWQTVTPLPVITNTAFASQKTLEDGAFEAWIEEQTRAEVETLETQVRTQLVEPESVSIGGSLLYGAQAGVEYMKGFGVGIWEEIKALKDLLDWKTWWGLLKIIGSLLVAIKDVGVAVLENGLGVMAPIADALSKAFATDTAVVKEHIAALKNQTTPFDTGKAVAFIVTALLPIGKLAKAGKLGTAGTKVLESIEIGVRQFKNTVKLLEAKLGSAVKSYRWNESKLAYEVDLADGSKATVGKVELEGGGNSTGTGSAFTGFISPEQKANYDLVQEHFDNGVTDNYDIVKQISGKVEIPTRPYGVSQETLDDVSKELVNRLKLEGVDLENVSIFATGSRVSGITLNPGKPDKFGKIIEDFTGRDLDISIVMEYKPDKEIQLRLEKAFQVADVPIGVKVKKAAELLPDRLPDLGRLFINFEK